MTKAKFNPETLDLAKKSIRHIRLNIVELEPRSGKNYTEVVFFGDVHFGSPACEIKKALSMLEYCLKNDVYVFLMGDLAENANRNSVGSGVYEQSMNPQKQLEFIIETLKPLADKHLLIGNIEGNHEERTYKDTGINITKIISLVLGVRYLGSACWNLFRVGGENYLVYALHGSSGSRFVYTKLKAVVDISHSFSADLIAMGHVHECADTSQLVQSVDLRNKIVREQKKFLLLTGHYLGYDESYAQAKGMPLSKLGSPKVKFFSDHHDIHISW
jgi:predicted MPP superfamily phosphohydrolase